MTRILATLFGIAFIFIGVAGFLPVFTSDGLLFGYFTPSVMHNIVHLLTGVIAIMAATSQGFAKTFFKFFGIIYTAAAIWGFWNNGDLYMMQVNLADNVLYIVIGILGLFIGFGKSKERS